MVRLFRRLLIVFILLFFTAGVIFCSGEGTKRGVGSMPGGDINEVFKRHVDEIMSIEGVVGVAVSALEDGTPCIKVLIKEDSSLLREKIPEMIEGYPVIIEVSGEIRAMDD